MDSATLRLQVSDIRCAACALKIEDAIRDLQGIIRCRTNVASKEVIVEHHPETLSSGDIQAQIEALGFSEVATAEGEQTGRDEAMMLLARLGVAGIGAMQVMMFALVTYVSGDSGVEPAYVKLMQWASFAIATPVALFSAIPFYQNATRDLLHGRVGMDVPVSIAILSAYTLSSAHMLGEGEVYFDSVCMFAFLLLLGRFLELRSRQRYLDNMTLADRCLPAESTLLDGSILPTESLQVGQVVIVKSGETIPVDGTVLEGTGQASESAFSGESTAYRKVSGANVLAGSELIDGELQVECTAAPDASVLAGMSKLYLDAMLYKPGFAVLADRVSRYFVATILVIALLSGGVWYLLGNPEWFVILITVLVVSCPCALSLATPIAYTVAVTALKQRGVVVRSGSFLEKLAQIDHIIFDKTGTLTEGRLHLETLRVLDKSWAEDEILNICAALEHGSKHPIARAFQSDTSFVAEQRDTILGEAVTGVINAVGYRLGKPNSAGLQQIESSAKDDGGTWIQLSAGDRLIALMCLRDEVRESSKALFARLPHTLSATLLSGDFAGEVNRIATLLGIGSAHGEQTPIAKLDFVRGQQAKGQKVLMVGDGFNDAAAMAAADAAIAVSPVDILLQEAADASLVRQDILRIAELLEFAQRLKKIVRQNITWAVFYNFSVIPLAVIGVLEPWMAALGMSLSSLAVVLNAGRLQKFGGV